MANYLQFGQVLAKHLPMTEGCTSTVKLSKKGIEALAKKNPELGKVIAEFTEGVTNPTLEIAQKAQGNYAIAGFKIRSGETVLGKGAYSTSTGAKGAVEKMHVEKGDIITTISKEGNAEAVVSDVSKTDLARAAQEKAKASEFMTKETTGLNGEKILTRKLKNGNTIETTVLDNGTIKTTVTMPDGKSYIRYKSFTKKDIDATKGLKEFDPLMGYRKFKRVDKNISYKVGGETYTEAPQGVVYGERFANSKPYIRREPLLRYKGYKADLSDKLEPIRYEISTVGKTPKVINYMNVDGYKDPRIVGKEALSEYSKLRKLDEADIANILK